MPLTNGKAERFIQTALREWAYAHSDESSKQRDAHLGKHPARPLGPPLVQRFDCEQTGEAEGVIDWRKTALRQVGKSNWHRACKNLGKP